VEKNPRARYATAEALADDLQCWLAGKPITARPISMPLRVRRWVKRNRVGAALIVSLFFGLGASLSFLAVLGDRMRTEEINKALERETLLQVINDRWALPAITNMVIPYTLLAEVRNESPRAYIEGRDVRLKFGMSVDQDPITRAHNVAPLLGELEQRMGQELRRNVFFDLHLSKSTHLEVQLLSTREADFQRMDALTYVRAKMRDPGVVPVVIENEADEIVFCVLQNSAISNLAQIKGCSIGFGDINSATTVMAQYALLTNGLRQSDLKPEYYTNLLVVSTTRVPEMGSAEFTTDMREVKSGREALRHLLEGKLDSAVTLKRYFEMRRYRGGGLRMIGKLPGSPEVFAARSGLEPNIVRAFGNAMLSLKQSPGLSPLTSFRTVTAVIAANDSHFDDLRLALTNVQGRFRMGSVTDER
jgi:ABC-type phosphate/phosphonate transport system substrate-binding protein